MTPEPFSQQATDYARIEQSIRYLQANFRRHPSLDQVAAAAGLSKYHFHRLFRRWAGVTPAQFLSYLTLEYAKRRLQEAHSVLDAALDAGLSGPGRLHDLFVTFEAVTPGDYKRQGAGLEIRYGVHPTPFGPCLLALTDRGICTLHFLITDDPARALAGLVASWPRASLLEDPLRTAPFITRIFASPAGGRPQPGPFHLLLRGTNFQVQVWRALLAIPHGALVSYQDVATLLGRPRATRAVAGAIARNPVAYLIPCHRVIAATGRIHGYRWGTARKQAILGWEAAHTPP